ncbi:hypothetical protein Syun_024084 [Stephania yunnanensis]|uniref:Uncharacterized protein n=1 Tax=Stephania yunnanensis TaxID=152371 RepID=A0AAP0I081_9MAGN
MAPKLSSPAEIGRIWGGFDSTWSPNLFHSKGGCIVKRKEKGGLFGKGVRCSVQAPPPAWPGRAFPELGRKVWDGPEPISIVGSTGSIGTQPSKHRSCSLSAIHSASAQSNRFKPLDQPEPNCAYITISQNLICHLDKPLASKSLATQIACTHPPGLHFLPDRPYATIQFYESILTFTQSIHFDHKSRENSVEIDFSKLKILRVLSVDDWCENFKFITKTPFAYKDISINKDKPVVSISYKDYIAAWTNILFYKDPDHHSWYLSFAPTCPKSFPQWWIINWWTKFGPHEFIFPKQVQQQFATDNIPMLQFLCKYNIPWILKWEYETASVSIYEPKNTNTNKVTYLSQLISSKWWNKFNYTAALATPSIAPPTPAKTAKLPSASTSYKDVVSKPSSEMALILAKLQQIEDDNKALRQKIHEDNQQLLHEIEQVTSRCSSSPSVRSVHLSDDDA